MEIGVLETIFGYSVAFFIFQPLNVFIHELGHAFFVKIYGGTIQKIEIGIGEHLFRIGKVQIKNNFSSWDCADTI
ncbi:M50 family metallopeptidase [Oceanobacillus luteolus]|uniref:M50 family metallopeptidase n=1 Tax=Oceanobacillus luteolus TaxID=1274358 RepID=UPI00203F7C71|nr:M50 family metallopeptidase [Oceanobacillus luteolus]MCM3741556.1 M50 family metallopeptidase [Oceanobacillus luteolus]